MGCKMKKDCQDCFKLKQFCWKKFIQGSWYHARNFKQDYV